MDGPAPGRWTVIRGKSAGVAPGFTVRDEKGEVWFLTFDARTNPMAPTSAVAVATRLFWALGYNQIESYLTSVRPENLVVGEGVTVRAHGGRRRIRKPTSTMCWLDRRGAPTARTAPSPVAPSPARFSVGSGITVRVPTIPTTSCRMNIAVSFARSRCSAAGPTSST